MYFRPLYQRKGLAVIHIFSTNVNVYVINVSRDKGSTIIKFKQGTGKTYSTCYLGYHPPSFIQIAQEGFVSLVVKHTRKWGKKDV